MAVVERRAVYGGVVTRRPGGLAIWGRHDRFTPFAGSRRLLAACPDARLVELHGCGHCPQLEVPERIAALLDQLPG
jgi:pimeloyl-ACP methyl ester carboxylesterase